jgi:CrcB protein
MTDWTEAAARVLWIALGGALGANARYWLGGWVQARAGVAFPWGTLAVNVTGSFALGLLMALLAGRPAGPNVEPLRLFTAIGVLGGYTTFSTFSYETVALLESGDWNRALLNAAGSVLASVFAAWLGMRLGRLL